MDQMPNQQKININWTYASYFGTPYDQIKYLQQLINFDDQMVTAYFNLGNCYYDLYQYDKAIAQYEKALDIYKKWDIKPFWVLNYTYLAESYHIIGQNKKAMKVTRNAEQDFPDDTQLIGWKAILSVSLGDTVAAKQYLDKLVTKLRIMSLTEANIMSMLAYGYNEADARDEAEEYYRKALSLEPENPDRMYSLAYYLIDKNRNLNEGMELADEALKMSPDNFYYLHAMGWGLYKQGNFKEALDILQRSWDLRREKAVYDHEAYLHLEAAKKAVANQKRTDR
jgi:tetratricopeptide (TPR) repeat protein